MANMKIGKPIICAVLFMVITVLWSTGNVSSKNNALNHLNKVLELTGDHVVEVSAGTYNSAALTAQGKVYVWGSNGSNHLGFGGSDLSSKTLPIELTALSSSSLGNNDRVIQIKYKYFRGIALTQNGRIFVWGDNFLGELGLGDSGEDTNRPTPTELMSLSPSSLPNGDKVIQVDYGTSYSGALTEQGKVFTWGRDSYGELGLGTSYQTFPSPNEVTALSPSSLPNGDTVKQISLGQSVSIALTNQGKVYTFGRNELGELGLGDNQNRDLPTQVTALSPSSLPNGDKVKQVDVLFRHVSAVTEQGRVYMWGDNSEGQLGLGDSVNRNVPTEVTALSPSSLPNGETVTKVKVGALASFALTNQGNIYSWGKNNYGVLGLGLTFDGVINNTPVKIPSSDISEVTQFSVGVFHVLALTEQKKVYGWGSNINGRLGLGDTTNRNKPTEVEFFTPAAEPQCNCASGQKCCETKLNGPICYKESERTCFGDLLCINGLLKCGDHCYSDSLYSCENGQLVQKSNDDDDSDDDDDDNNNGCPAGMKRCETKLNGPICYKESERTCFGDLLCVKGLLKCGNHCYSESQYSCQNGQLVQN